MIFQSYKVITQAHRGSQKWKSHSIMLFKGPCWHKQTMQWCEGPVLTKVEGFISSVPLPSSETGSRAQCARTCSQVQERSSPKGASAIQSREALHFKPLSLFSFSFSLSFFLSNSDNCNISQLQWQVVCWSIMGTKKMGSLLHKVWRSTHSKCLNTNSLWLVIWEKVYFHANCKLYIHSRMHNQQNMKLYYGLWC